jgi:hypothetical protein
MGGIVATWPSNARRVGVAEVNRLLVSAPLSDGITLPHQLAFNSGNSIGHQYRDHLVPVAAVNAKIGVQGENLPGPFEFR